MALQAAEMEQHLGDLVRRHRHTDTPVVFAARYRREANDIYLLEVCEGVVDPGDASWDTLEFVPPRQWGLDREARLLLTYLSPAEFFRAREQPASHGRKLLEEIRREGLRELYAAPDHPYSAAIRQALSDASAR